LVVSISYSACQYHGAVQNSCGDPLCTTAVRKRYGQTMKQTKTGHVHISPCLLSPALTQHTVHTPSCGLVHIAQLDCARDDQSESRKSTERQFASSSAANSSHNQHYHCSCTKITRRCCASRHLLVLMVLGIMVQGGGTSEIRGAVSLSLGTSRTEDAVLLKVTLRGR
jgi:hypothetical protein